MSRTNSSSSALASVSSDRSIQHDTSDRNSWLAHSVTAPRNGCGREPSAPAGEASPPMRLHGRSDRSPGSTAAFWMKSSARAEKVWMRAPSGSAKARRPSRAAASAIWRRRSSISASRVARCTAYSTKMASRISIPTTCSGSVGAPNAALSERCPSWRISESLRQRAETRSGRRSSTRASLPACDSSDPLRARRPLPEDRRDVAGVAGPLGVSTTSERVESCCLHRVSASSTISSTKIWRGISGTVTTFRYSKAASSICSLASRRSLLVPAAPFFLPLADVVSLSSGSSDWTRACSCERGREANNLGSSVRNSIESAWIWY
mmetsp:Transcript_31107/g.100467  ORF Transcript_31107/g.100467 Transcript_31107/m.100467 type:complete len:321 (+) Transcript_31107:3999-4961(+)